MATFVKEILLVDCKTYTDQMINFGLEDDNSFFISNDRDDSEAIYLSFSFDDWLDIKKFIDDKFREVRKPF